MEAIVETGIRFTGKTGVIEHGSGNLTIQAHEIVTFEGAVVRVQHRDLYESETLLPIFTIRMIRWHDMDKQRQHGHNKPFREGVGEQRSLPRSTLEVDPTGDIQRSYDAGRDAENFDDADLSG